MAYEITSPANERIRRLAGLRARKARDEESLFPVEEMRIIQRGVAAGHVPIEVYWCPDLIEKPSLGDVPYVSVSADALGRAAYRSSPEGCLALFRYWDTGLGRIRADDDLWVLVAESLEKPGNLGAMLRIADAAGMSGVIVADETVDPFNPNVVRASTGTIFSVPIAIAPIAEAFEWLSAHRLRSVAGVAEAPVALWDADLTGPLAFWVGAEAAGLSDAARQIADQEVSIPMSGLADSLNVSVSAGVLVYEAMRQRQH